MPQQASMISGKLFIVATPIGNLSDISQRAIEVLQQVDVIVAEDTRHSHKLLQSLAIQKPLMTLHAHNEQHQSNALIEKLQQGQQIAVISDAGTPLISDPGMPLVRLARQQGITVIPIPGACAAITALSAAGLPCDKFYFAGFLPAKTQARRNALEHYQQSNYTVIFYEAPHRILESMQDMLWCFEPSREVVIAKELTKTFEKFFSGTISAALTWLTADPNNQRGEFVVLLAACIPSASITLDPELKRILTVLLPELPLKQAVKLAAELSGVNKNKVYELALELKGSAAL